MHRCCKVEFEAKLDTTDAYLLMAWELFPFL